MKEKIKVKLLEAGVKNLHEFGYEGVNKQNILTDMVYSAFFLNMLKQNKGINPTADEAIKELIDTITESK